MPSCYRRVLLAIAAVAIVASAPRLVMADGDRWSFQPIVPPDTPTVAGGSWTRTPIDAFVLARLERAGIDPSPEADKPTLIRRAYADLLGLPPSWEDVERFRLDDSEDAYERLVDRLLASPEYGRRWGRHWLDVARYSDTKGYTDAGEGRYPFAFTYRDWVVDALNADMPFDRFVVAQIAADRAALDDPSSLAALGFLTVGSRYNFFPHEIIDDRIDVVTRGLMALTVTCARCHDHKYDPISAADYYALYGMFASSREPVTSDLPFLGTARDSDELRDAVEKKAAEYRTRREELHRQIAYEMRARARDYLVYIVQRMPEHRTVAQPPLRTPRGVVREFTAYGNGGVIRWQRYIAECGDDDAVFGLWNRLVRLRRERVADEAARLVSDPSVDWIHPLLAARVVERRPETLVEIASLIGELLEETEAHWQKELAERPDATAFSDPAREHLRRVLYGSDSPAVITIDESEDLYHLDEHTDVRSKFAAIERAQLADPGRAPRAMVVVDREHCVDAPIFERGDPTRPGRVVPRRLPELLRFLDPEPLASGSGRLELARAIASPRNPLTARVIVNRIWAWHFGTGLVATPSDFGTRSAAPSHPGLLDYLADRLVRDDWSLKRIHREILLSAAWRQASEDRPELRDLDPENRLLWRMNRRRLEFEAMRDSMLAVADELSQRSRGQPIDAKIDAPENRYPSIACVIDREKLHGLLRVFDFPNPDLSCPERPETTVPQQALFLLNSPFVLARAEALARVTRRAAPEDRIRALWRRVYSRDPRRDELSLALAFTDRGDAILQAIAAEPSPWRYGFGRVDPSDGRVHDFRELPHFDGAAWQGAANYPDAELHYLQLTAIGGHAGIDDEHAAIRRWIAPADGAITIGGEVRHGRVETCGDGVVARAVSSRHGEMGEWTLHEAAASVNVETTVDAGDTIDFVVGRRGEHSCDVFDWAPLITWIGSTGAKRTWSAETDFRGAAPLPPPSPWTELALILLQSSEFLFVD